MSTLENIICHSLTPEENMKTFAFEKKFLGSNSQNVADIRDKGKVCGNAALLFLQGPKGSAKAFSSRS